MTASMMLFFMLALARLPLGTASALEFLGPLAVSLYGPGHGRRAWTAAAAAGVLLLTQPWHGASTHWAWRTRLPPRPVGPRTSC
ncbi:hypothetical protein ACFQZC_36165 [Streptacidiphilus monticola]